MNVREELLRMLEEGTPVSGEQIARKLGVSRNAVWKAVDRLRKDGFGIEGGTNRGYRLTRKPDRLEAEAITGYLTTREIGRALEVYDEIDSTNSRAKMLAARGAAQGTTVVADCQTMGRGRRGRSFFSPEHSGIYFSMILRPDCTPEKAAMITSLAAVAVARAIEKVAETEIRIKWVNDLYIGGKKVCGILSEAGTDMESGQLNYVVVGIGVNVQPMDFPEELRNIATSIGNETGGAVDRNRLTAEICNETESLLGQLESGEFMAENRRRSNVIGREVLVLEGGKQYTAQALDIDGEGKLILRRDGEILHLGFGEVSLKPEGKGWD